MAIQRRENGQSIEYRSKYLHVCLTRECTTAISW
jgi:hypothetical protein